MMKIERILHATHKFEVCDDCKGEGTTRTPLYRLSVGQVLDKNDYRFFLVHATCFTAAVAELSVEDKL